MPSFEKILFDLCVRQGKGWFAKTRSGKKFVVLEGKYFGTWTLVGRNGKFETFYAHTVEPSYVSTKRVQALHEYESKRIEAAKETYSNAVWNTNAFAGTSADLRYISDRLWAWWELLGRPDVEDKRVWLEFMDFAPSDFWLRDRLQFGRLVLKYRSWRKALSKFSSVTGSVTNYGRTWRSVIKLYGITTVEQAELNIPYHRKYCGYPLALARALVQHGTQVRMDTVAALYRTVKLDLPRDNVSIVWAQERIDRLNKTYCVGKLDDWHDRATNVYTQLSRLVRRKEDTKRLAIAIEWRQDMLKRFEELGIQIPPGVRPLVTEEDYIQEGLHMKHCVSMYANQKTMCFHIDAEDGSEATLELAVAVNNSIIGVVTRQLCAAGNGEPSDGCQQLAQATRTIIATFNHLRKQNEYAMVA